MCSFFSHTWLWKISAYTPAAFITVRASTSPWEVVTCQPSAVLSIFCTSVPKRNSTPFFAADSARPKVSSNGQIIPEVSASRAAHTLSLRLDSRFRASSPVKMLRPGTPFATPRSYSSRSLGMSPSSRHTTKAPTRLKGMSSSSLSFVIISLPCTFILAFMVPGSASNPAWTMAEFALLVPSHTSPARSSTRNRPSRRESSRAMALPVTPAPIITASYLI